MRTAKQLIETFDTIGNRTQTQAGGDQNGANLRVANYTNNTLNQITSRGVPGYVDVMGDALATNSVTVNGQTAYRKNEYYRQQLSVANTSAAVWQSVTNASPGQTSVTGNAYLAKTPETYTYDADGNLLSDGRWTYSWDAENRLTNMTSLSGAPSGSQLNLSFVYDYQGRRIQKLVLTNSGSAYVGEYTNNYVYDGWNCLAILNPSLGLVESFMWGSDLSGTIQGAGGVGGLIKVTYYASTTTNCFVAFDGNGNVSALVNAANGVTVANYDYGPFGELIRASGPMAKLNPFRFSTKYDDDESDFLYYGHRYYNPSTGRFISRDPIAEKGGINLYILANNNPLIRVDAFGLDFDPSPYSWLAQAYSWFMTEIVNQVFVKTTLIHDVSCPPGSSRYLLARHEHIVREKSHVVVTLFGIDFVNQTAVKPIMDAVEETYGCCGGCGLFAFNTTSWTYQETQSSGADQGGDKSFGPANLEYTLQTITQDKDKKRQCVNSVSPSWSWNEFDGN